MVSIGGHFVPMMAQSGYTSSMRAERANSLVGTGVDMVDDTGNSSVLLVALPLAVPLLLINLLVWNALSYFVVAVFYNMLTGTTDLFMNAEASVVERDLKRPVFSSFHAAVLYAIGGFGLLERELLGAGTLEA